MAELAWRDVLERACDLALIAALAFGGCGGALPPQQQQQLPEKDGVPIGDCVEPSFAQLESLGCPVTPPVVNAPCTAPDGTVCRYGIDVAQGMSYQTLFDCFQGSWGPGAREGCGVVCGITSMKVVPLDATGCNERTPTECIASVTYAWPPSGLTRSNQALRDALNACNAMQYDVKYEIVFNNGCPVQLAVSDDSLTDAQTSCLAALLSGVRWQCALELPCASFDLSSLL